MYVYIYICMNTYIYEFMYIYVFIYIYTFTHTHTTHTHTHTHTPTHTLPHTHSRNSILKRRRDVTGMRHFLKPLYRVSFTSFQRPLQFLKISSPLKVPTVWRGCIGCLDFLSHFPKRALISGTLAEKRPATSGILCIFATF